jgi:nitroreductase
MHFPPEGQEPNTFVVICSKEQGHNVDIDTGIVAQTMLLRAVEMGLKGLCIGSFDKERVRELLKLPMEPRLVVAIGRGAEQVEIVDIGEEESHCYYRRGERHIVPKLRLEDLIIK